MEMSEICLGKKALDAARGEYYPPPQCLAVVVAVGVGVKRFLRRIVLEFCVEFQRSKVERYISEAECSSFVLRIGRNMFTVLY